MGVIRRCLEWLRIYRQKESERGRSAKKDSRRNPLPDPLADDSGIRKMTASGSFPIGVIPDKKIMLRLFFIFVPDRPDEVCVVLNREKTIAVNEGKETKASEAAKIRFFTRTRLQSETYAGLTQVIHPKAEELVAKTELKKIKERGDYILVCKVNVGEESSMAIQGEDGRLSTQFIQALFDKDLAKSREICGERNVEMHFE